MLYETWRCLSRKIGKNNHTCPMFDNDLLASSKQMKLCTRDYIFPIKQDDICDYNPLCFMYSGLMLDDIIMNLFTDSTKNSTQSQQKHFFQNPGWYYSLVQRIYSGFYTGKKKCWYKKDITFVSLHWMRKIRKISVWYLIYR